MKFFVLVTSEVPVVVDLSPISLLLTILNPLLPFVPHRRLFHDPDKDRPTSTDSKKFNSNILF